MTSQISSGNHSRRTEPGDPVRLSLRVVLAEDDVLLREGMASLLTRSGIDVVGQAGDAAQLLSVVRDTSPDLVVVDIRMPPTQTTEGLDAARVIRGEHPETGILVLSAHADVEDAMELLASGQGIGYLLKSASPTSQTFSTPWRGSPRARLSWTRRLFRNWCRTADATIRSPRSVRANGKSWR